ncbi:MAG: hypothetical protein HY978_03765 [Candidatus Liptonbacteria bacterium]|nr:hypothetical protein [Candidatus Liptonbacteria bacterium]
MAIIILWGGIQIMTARGNPEQVSQGGKTIWWGVIGFGIILLATSVPYILKSAFGLGP